MTADGSKVYFTTARTAHAGRPRRQRRPLHVVSEGEAELAHPGLEGQQPGNRRTGEQRRLQLGSFTSQSTVKNCDVVTYSNIVLLPAGRRPGRQLPLRQLDRLRERRHLLLLAGAARRLPRRSRTRRTSTTTATAHVQYVTTFSRRIVLLRQPGSRLHRRGLHDTPIAQDAGLAGRQPHGFRHRQPGHPVRQRRPPRDVPL